NGLLCWYPEVLRIHAYIFDQTGRKEDAARFLEEAADMATAQNAKLWLLRTRLDQLRSGRTDASTVKAVVQRFDARAQPPEIAQANALLSII
ncbi:MAG: hypothetical protein NWP79_09605, partial [Paracoccaceae bacterium]|nr:hypothetical protein [Paracoccaceae bacterium]